MRNPYEVLGVEPAADAAAIRTAYRKLAKKLHPDLNPGDKGAEDKFKEVAVAYDLLGDVDKRRRFDAGEIDATGAERPPEQPFYRNYATSDDGERYTAGQGFADFAEGDDPFAELLRRGARARANRRGQDLHYNLPIELGEAITGASKRVTMPDGSTLDVNIPAGIVDGQVMRLRGKGAPGSGTGGTGDALVEISILPDPRFVLDGDDLLLDLPVSLAEAVLGGEITVPTVTGAVTMRIPKGSNSGTVLRLRGKGMPRRGGGAGDQLNKLVVVLPKPPDAELERFVAGWDGASKFNPRQNADWFGTRSARRAGEGSAA